MPRLMDKATVLLLLMLLLLLLHQKRSQTIDSSEPSARVAVEGLRRTCVEAPPLSSHHSAGKLAPTGGQGEHSGRPRPSRALLSFSRCALAAFWRRFLALTRRLASFSALSSAVLRLLLAFGFGLGLGTALLLAFALAPAAVGSDGAGGAGEDEDKDDEDDEDDMASKTYKK